MLDEFNELKAKVNAEINRQEEFIISTAFSYGYDVYVQVAWKDYDIYISFTLSNPADYTVSPSGKWTFYRRPHLLSETLPHGTFSPRWTEDQYRVRLAAPYEHD